MNTVHIWILPGWSRTFERNVLCYYFFVAAPLSALAVTYLGVAGLLVSFIGFWPFPYRARWIPDGLEVRWLFLRERLCVEDITSARLRADFRRLRFVRYKEVLEIELAGRRPAIVVASSQVLEALHGKLQMALARRAAS